MCDEHDKRMHIAVGFQYIFYCLSDALGKIQPPAAVLLYILTQYCCVSMLHNNEQSSRARQTYTGNMPPLINIKYTTCHDNLLQETL